MELLYKPDWEQTKERYRAWWAHEYFGRCAFSVTAPRQDAAIRPAPPDPTTVEQRWYDLDHIADCMEYHLGRTYFGGEALPVWNGGYPGHTSLPVFMGCRCELDWTTGWVYPRLTSAQIECAALRVDEGCREYRFALELLRRGVREAEGRCLVSVGAFGGCGDTLASLRSTGQLLYDCLDRPEQVRAAERFCMDAFITYYETVCRLTRQANEGSVCWFGMWAPGRHYCAHNDFSYMISPRMFRELFLDSIERQTRYLEYTVYHVDGICAFAHVPALCELPRLQAIQILPGAGKPSPLHYLDVLRQVQAAGKNLHITIPPEEVRPALELLSARGLHIQTWCESEPAARALLRDAETWSVDRG
jgi:hypothetical protein